jgi:SPP1 gp7 family putative phage head morphogenesis protein
VPARAELADVVRKIGVGGDVERRLRAWARHTASFEPLGDAIFVPAVKADLAGQLMVCSREARVIQLDAKDAPYTFLDLPWKEALQAFRERVPTRKNELQRLLKDYAQRADAARRLALEQIQAFVKTRLEKHIADGGLYRDFAQDLEDGKQTLGITTADPAYLRMVFRTGVQSAYGAGKFRAATDPDVVEEMPYVQYRTVGDARVRPAHAILDRGIYHAASDAWHRIAPPNGYSCRCSLVSLSRDDVKGQTILGQVPAGYEATPEFDAPPVAKISGHATRGAAAKADPIEITKDDAEGETPPPSWQTRAPANKQMSRQMELAFNPSQPRASDGKWSDVGYDGRGWKGLTPGMSRLQRKAHVLPHKRAYEAARKAHLEAPTEHTAKAVESARESLRYARKVAGSAYVDPRDKSRDLKESQAELDSARSYLDAHPDDYEAKYDKRMAEDAHIENHVRHSPPQTVASTITDIHAHDTSTAKLVAAYKIEYDSAIADGESKWDARAQASQLVREKVLDEANDKMLDQFSEVPRKRSLPTEQRRAHMKLARTAGRQRLKDVDEAFRRSV